MTNTLLDVMKKARKLIDKPEKHCKGVLAEDINGQAVHISQSHAKKFCIYGACLKIDPTFTGFPDDITSAFFDGNAHIFNDKNPHSVVLSAYDEAIEYLTLTN